MTSPALNHFLRTMAAVPTGQRVLLRGAEDGRWARPLARLGFEVHAGTWSEAAARHVQEALEGRAPEQEGAGDAPVQERAAPAYATAAPLRALPYPEAHFGWVAVRLAPLLNVAEEERPQRLQGLLEEARHHLRPGGWVYVAAPALADASEAPAPFTADGLGRAAQRAALAEAEAPAHAERDGRAALHAIYRRVEDDTPL